MRYRIQEQKFKGGISTFTDLGAQCGFFLLTWSSRVVLEVRVPRATSRLQGCLRLGSAGYKQGPRGYNLGLHSVRSGLL